MRVIGDVVSRGLFAREGAIGRKLLDTVKKDLEDVVKVCVGELKQTNHLHTLMSALTKGFDALSYFPGFYRLTFFCVSI